MTNTNSEGVGFPLPAQNFEDIKREIETILNPQSTVRYQEDQTPPQPEPVDHRPKNMGRHGVRLYLIKQVRDDLATVFAFPGRKYHENV